MKANYLLKPQQGRSDVGWGTGLTFFLLNNLLLKHKSGKSKGNYTHCVSKSLSQSHRYF